MCMFHNPLPIVEWIDINGEWKIADKSKCYTFDQAISFARHLTYPAIVRNQCGRGKVLFRNDAMKKLRKKVKAR